MKFDLKHICASFLILLSGMAFAQENECLTVDLDYVVEISAGSELKGKAEVTYQDKSYHMLGNGIESYCDGATVWLIDHEAKEVYIEPLSPENEEYMETLAGRLSGIKDGGSLSFVSPEGQQVYIKANYIKKSAGKDISSFRPTYDFDTSWVVTDLR